MVSKDEIIVDPVKIEAICDWTNRTYPSEVHSFIHLGSYYKWLVEGFDIITTPMTRLT